MNCPRIAGVECPDATDVCCIEDRIALPTTVEEPARDMGAVVELFAPPTYTEEYAVPTPLNPTSPCPTSGLPCDEAAKLSPICCADVPPADAKPVLCPVTWAQCAPAAEQEHDCLAVDACEHDDEPAAVTLDLTVLSIDDLFTELLARLVGYSDDHPFHDAHHLVRIAHEYVDR